MALEADLQGLDWLRFEVEADKVRTLRLFLTTLPFANPAEEADVEIWIEDQTTRERVSAGTVFLAPDEEGWGP